MSEYQELLEKLIGERKIISEKNAKIAELEQANLQMNAFIAAFEFWLDNGILSRTQRDGVKFSLVRNAWRNLKVEQESSTK